MRAAWSLLLIGCLGTTPTTPPPVVVVDTPAPKRTGTPATAPNPTAELLVYEDDGTIRFFEVTATAYTQTRQVKLRLRPAKIEWLHRDPVVLLELPLGGGTAKQKKYDGEVGVITQDGYQPVPAVPPSWPPPGVGHDPDVDLIVTANDEIWAGRCEWASGAKSCVDWIYARVAPDPLITAKVAPARAPMPQNPGWAGPGVELVADPAGNYVRCTLDRGVTEFPSKDERRNAGVSQVSWIRAEPPTYRVITSTGQVWFKGCSQTDRMFVFVLPGPAGFTALYAGSFIEVLYEGRSLGTIRPTHGGAINPRWRPQP